MRRIQTSLNFCWNKVQSSDLWGGTGDLYRGDDAETMLNVRVYFLDLLVIFCTCGQAKGGSFLFIWPNVGLSYAFFSLKNGNNGKGRAVKDEGPEVSWKCVGYTSEWVWVDLHIFTDVSIWQLESGQLFSSNSAFDTEGNEWRVVHFISRTYTVQKLFRETDI